MKCSKAKYLISLDLSPRDSWLDAQDRKALAAHMAICEACRRDWRESREAIVFLRRHWRLSKDTCLLLEKGQPRPVPVRSASVAWMARASAVAACLVIGVLGWREIASRRIPVTRPEGPAAFAAADAPSTIHPAGEGEDIAVGATVQTLTGEIETLALPGGHQLVMNAGTRLSIVPLAENGRIGCLVSLALGEICVHAEHDGNPFVVRTAHGWATITGTTFDVTATATDTTLVVAEGSVRFESLQRLSPATSGEKVAVQVMAGQQSTIAASSLSPSTPRACNARALTAWAKAGRGTFRAARRMPASDSSLHELPLPAVPWIEVQTDPNRIDYAAWIEQKREWFQQQFPWIFKLRDVLIAENRRPPSGTLDYPVLLVQSGDIWRFAYPRADASRQVEQDPNGLFRAAAQYGRDESWLERQALVAPPATIRGQWAMGVTAFERWVQTIEADADLHAREVDGRVLRETLEACRYLVETRTLAILWLSRDPGSMTPSARREVPALLREELRILACCVRLSYELGLDWSGANSCECPDRTGALLEEIRKLGELEKQVREHVGIPRD